MLEGFKLRLKNRKAWKAHPILMVLPMATAPMLPVMAALSMWCLGFVIFLCVNLFPSAKRRLDVEKDV